MTGDTTPYPLLVVFAVLAWAAVIIPPLVRRAVVRRTQKGHTK